MINEQNLTVLIFAKATFLYQWFVKFFVESNTTKQIKALEYLNILVRYNLLVNNVLSFNKRSEYP